MINILRARTNDEEQLEKTLVEKVSMLPQLFRSIRPYNKGI